MNKLRLWLYSLLASLPFIGLLFYLLFPPQCPPEYTQQQVDASRCIIGANIGGAPLFIVGIPIIIVLSHLLLGAVIRRNSRSKR